MKRRTFSKGMLATLAVLGAGGGESHAQGKPRLAMVVGDMSNAFHNRLWKAAQKQAESLGATLDAVTTNRDIQTEADVIDQFLTQQYDAILVMPTSAEGSVAGIDRVVAAGVPVVTVLDSVVGSGDKYYYVGSDFEPWGDMVLDRISKSIGKGNVVYIKGAPGFLVTQARDRNVKEALKHHPELKITYEQFGDWTKNGGVTQMEDALTRSPQPRSIQAVFTMNDNMSLGAVEALKRAGRLSEVVVGGSDGNPDALHSIIVGEMAFTTFQDAETIGARAVQVALDLIKGKKPAKMIGVQWKMIDSPAIAKDYLVTVYGER